MTRKGHKTLQIWNGCFHGYHASRRTSEDEDDPQNGTNRVLGERVITTGGQIRELAKVIEDPTAVKRLEETRSLQAATLSSDLLVKNEIDGAIERSNQDAARLFELAPKMSSNELDRIENLVARLQAVAVSQKRQPATATTTDQPWKVYTEVPQSHFGSVIIDKYRALENVILDQLGRVNLVVGINNAGKTSALEAVYLLANQADPRGLLELLRRRTRMDPVGTPTFSVTQLPQDVVSRPRELPPQPLAEPYVTLSRHTAPVIQPCCPVTRQ